MLSWTGHMHTRHMHAAAVAAAARPVVSSHVRACLPPMLPFMPPFQQTRALRAC